MLYLDNSSTTKVLPEVFNEMAPYISQYYGNPNSKYYSQAIKAGDAVNLSREKIASLIKCNAEEVIFTSGSTESNNFILKGYIHANKKKGNHLIVSSVEHSSIMNSAKFLEENGTKVTYLPVNRNGFISPSDLEKNITKETLLVSIMWSNNELGSINNIKELSKICHKHNIKFHTDATQFVGKGKIDLTENICVDFLSLSAHKFYGPKGIGIAFIRKEANGLFPKITPLLHGGEQEKEFRAGTLAVHQIVGMGKAAEITNRDLEKNIEILRKEEIKFIGKMKEVFGSKFIINNEFTERVPGLISARIKGQNNQLLLKKASDIFAASTGSACSNTKPSYVLKACNYSEEEIRETIRFSLSPYSDYSDFKEIE